jgi:hypothetical protein
MDTQAGMVRQSGSNAAHGASPHAGPREPAQPGRPVGTLQSLDARRLPPRSDGRISMDPMQTTDRYRLAMPWSMRF